MAPTWYSGRVPKYSLSGHVSEKVGKRERESEGGERGRVRGEGCPTAVARHRPWLPMAG